MVISFKCTKPGKFERLWETNVVQIDYWIENGRDIQISCKIAYDHSLDGYGIRCWELWEPSATDRGSLCCPARTKSSRVRFDMPEDAAFVCALAMLMFCLKYRKQILWYLWFHSSCFLIFWINPEKSIEFIELGVICCVFVEFHDFMCISSQSSHIIFLSGHAANPSKFECCTEALIDLQKSAGNIWVNLNVINACLDGMYTII